MSVTSALRGQCVVDKLQLGRIDAGHRSIIILKLSVLLLTLRDQQVGKRGGWARGHGVMSRLLQKEMPLVRAQIKFGGL